MAFPVYIPLAYESRFALLGAMARQLAEAFARRGCPVNPPGPPGDQPSLVVYFNFLPEIGDLHPSIVRPGSRAAIVQFMVDHPMALHEAQMDATSRLPNFRVLMPCVDGTHMLRMRWPNLVHGHCLHGIGPESLADAGAIEASHAPSSGARPMDVVVMGSIHTEQEIATLRGAVPAQVRGLADDAVDLLVAHPTMPFEQALDLPLGAGNIPAGQWGLAALVWRYVSAAVNRARRIGVVRSLRGLSVSVFGGGAWTAECTGSIAYRGEVGYADAGAVMQRAKVAIAWGPTQFVHSFSERILLALASGAATVADDRLLVRRHFGVRAAGDRTPGPVTVARGNDGDSIRASVEELLADPVVRGGAGGRGRDAVARGHLWEHLLDLIASVVARAIAA